MSVTQPREQAEGRLCGDCFKPIAKGEPIQAHPNGRHYHLDCAAGKVLFGDLLGAQVREGATDGPVRRRQRVR
jgi:hypothetical protein